MTGICTTSKAICTCQSERLAYFGLHLESQFRLNPDDLWRGNIREEICLRCTLKNASTVKSGSKSEQDQLVVWVYLCVYPQLDGSLHCAQNPWCHKNVLFQHYRLQIKHKLLFVLPFCVFSLHLYWCWESETISTCSCHVSTDWTRLNLLSIIAIHTLSNDLFLLSASAPSLQSTLPYNFHLSIQFVNRYSDTDCFISPTRGHLLTQTLLK